MNYKYQNSTRKEKLWQREIWENVDGIIGKVRRRDGHGREGEREGGRGRGRKNLSIYIYIYIYILYYIYYIYIYIYIYIIIPAAGAPFWSEPFLGPSFTRDGSGKVLINSSSSSVSSRDSTNLPSITSIP